MRKVGACDGIEQRLTRVAGTEGVFNVVRSSPVRSS